MTTRQQKFLKITKISLILAIFIYVIVQAIPLFIDTILDKLEEEREWRRERLEKYYGEELEEYRRQNYVYYDENGKCIKNCNNE